MNFILLALCVFAIIKALNTAKDRFKKEEAVEEAAPAKSDEVVLLEEIRDLLKKNA
nr:MscL family protein [uncultured Sharpea sp.]